VSARRAIAAALLELALAGASRPRSGWRAAVAGRWPPVVVVVWLGLEADLVEGAAGAAAVGWILDVLAGVPAGLLASLSVALFLLARLARGALALQGAAGFAALAAAGTLFLGLGAVMLTRAAAPPGSAPPLGILWRVALEGALTGLAAAPLHAPLRWLGRRLEREPDAAWPRGLS
jgi:hypothetical protein